MKRGLLEDLVTTVHQPYAWSCTPLCENYAYSQCLDFPNSTNMSTNFVTQGKKE